MSELENNWDSGQLLKIEDQLPLHIFGKLDTENTEGDQRSRQLTVNDEQIKMAKQPVQVPIAESGATSWRPYQAAPQSEYKQQPSFGGSRSSVVQ